jgi:hypothetical protein
MAFPSTHILDDFNRADEMPLNQANWRDVFGVVVNTNRAEVSPDGLAYGASVYSTVFGPDCDAYVFIPTIDTGGLMLVQAIIFARADMTLENAYAVDMIYNGGGGADRIVLACAVAGVPAFIGIYGGLTLVDGDGIGIRCEGNNISAYRYTGGAWGLLGTVADATHPGAGFFGLFAWPNSAGIGGIPVKNFGVGNEAGGAFPTPGVIDKFDRANEGPPPSASWVDEFVMGVIGNQCASRQVIANHEMAMLWRTSFMQDQEVYVTVRVRQIDGVSFNIYARYQNTNNKINLEVLREDHAGGDTVIIYETVAGVGAIIAGPYSIVYQDGDSFGIYCAGTTIEAWHKPVASVWTLLGSGVTTLPLTDGYIGISGNDTTIRLDDFGGGDFAQISGTLIDLHDQVADYAPAHVINLVQDDTLPVLVFRLMDASGGVYDLSTATTTLRVRARDAEPGTFIINEACDYVPVSGYVQYDLQAGELAAPGEYYCDLQVDFGGRVLTSELFLIRIREAL